MLQLTHFLPVHFAPTSSLPRCSGLIVPKRGFQHTPQLPWGKGLFFPLFYFSLFPTRRHAGSSPPRAPGPRGADPAGRGAAAATVPRLARVVRVRPHSVSPCPAERGCRAWDSPAVPPPGERGPGAPGVRGQPRSGSSSRVTSPCSRGGLRTAVLLGAGLLLLPGTPVLPLAGLLASRSAGSGCRAVGLAPQLPRLQVLHWARECPAHRFHPPLSETLRLLLQGTYSYTFSEAHFQTRFFSGPCLQMPQIRQLLRSLFLFPP